MTTIACNEAKLFFGFSSIFDGLSSIFNSFRKESLHEIAIYVFRD